MSPASHFVATITVILEDVEPQVRRKLIVPLNLRMDRLHIVLQIAFGWTDSHLYEFRYQDIGWGVPDHDFGTDLRDASKATLLRVLQETNARAITYLYDFGDGWEHTIRINFICEPEPGALYPQLILAEGRTPPEDIGGPPGFELFLEAINDPSHDDHAEMREWYLENGFDPRLVDVDAIEGELKRYARKWNPKAKAK
ncbi:plasmid pRiA4b ORF-3 family protein [Pelagibacterium sp.]|uniref:plasmid pRiA4b ORF-3 family protein n=1 Tax=Pelagibacterium sp. TaxID=1967288 RepID=UPI003BA89E67